MRWQMVHRAILALLVLCGQAPIVRAGDMPEPIEIPVVGRPADLPFSEAAGNFEVSGHAEPTTVQAEQPVLFTLRVHAEGRVYLPPQRIDLSKVPAFNDNFFIEDPKQDTHVAATQTWLFVYRLKPRRMDVTEIPGVPFVYFDPAIQPASKGFQTPYTEPIPLHVTAAETLAAPPSPVPDLFLQTRTGPEVLAHRAPWSPPSWPLLAVLLLMPPVACAAWYVVWRRLYPDAARRVKQRRSRAATVALKQLERLPRGTTEVRAAHIAAAVTTYLQQRLDLPAAEPTPAEAAAHLRTAGYPDTLTQRAEQFFQTCDAARFYPNASAADLPAFAQQLILDLEAHTWASVQS
jgi:hypothetical protein